MSNPRRPLDRIAAFVLKPRGIGHFALEQGLSPRGKTICRENGALPRGDWAFSPAMPVATAVRQDGAQRRMPIRAPLAVFQASPRIRGS